MMSTLVPHSIGRFGIAVVLMGWMALLATPARSCLGQEPQAERGSKALDDEMAMDPEFINAYHKLDESLKYEPRKKIAIRNRLVAVGFFGGLVLTLLGLLFIYLRLDHATRGFYSGRLQSVGIGILVLILIGSYLLWTQVLF